MSKEDRKRSQDVRIEKRGENKGRSTKIHIAKIEIGSIRDERVDKIR